MLIKNHFDFWVTDGNCYHHREYIIAFFVRVHIFYNLKWISRDYRDKNNRKRTINSAAPRKHKKLSKILHN